MRFDEADIGWLAGMLADAAVAEIMPRFRRLSAGDIRQKTSAADLVTEADINAERVITAAIAARYPGALVVGEEAHETDRSLLPRLGGAELAFVIDPVDGTFNFASDVPLFGVMLAVVVDGETVAGIIHDPVGKDFLIGVRGAGSHVHTVDGRRVPVRVAQAVPISQMTGAVSWQYRPEPERSLLARNQAKCLSQIGYRCAAHEYRLIASGHAHFAVYNKVMPWDHLTGVLIHQEAGGYAARLDGIVYSPGHVDGGLMIAPDRASWLELRRELWAK
jgi:fructose-1,6-bisphosphatase/inositol monophosphatase family enzyme